MLRENRKATLLGAMALVASATAKLQRLKAHALCSTALAAKATTHKDFSEPPRARKMPPARDLTVGLKSSGEKSKFISFVTTASTRKNSQDLTRIANTFSARLSTARLKSRCEKSKPIPSAAKAAAILRRLRHD